MNLFKTGIVLARAENSPGPAHMFIIEPFSGAHMDSLFSTHPATTSRVAALIDLHAEVSPATSGQGSRPASSSVPSVGSRNATSRNTGPWG